MTFNKKEVFIMLYLTYNSVLFKQTQYTDYYVSQCGEVLTVKIKGGRGLINYNEPRIMTYKTDKDGYKEYSLSLGSPRKIKYVRGHRLVFTTWIGDIPDGYVIDHVNHHRDDNSLCNLRLFTYKQNRNHTRIPLEEIHRKRRHYYDIYFDDVLQGTFWAGDVYKIGLSRTDFIRGVAMKKQTNRCKELKVVFKKV